MRKVKDAIALTILTLLALTPIFNIREVFAFLSGNLKGFASLATPIYMKAIKDIGFLIIAALSIFTPPLAMRGAGFTLRKKTLLYSAPFLFFTAILFILSFMNSPFEALAGLRWIAPIFLAIFLQDNIDDKLMAKIAKIVAAVFLFSFAVQIFELFKTIPFWGDAFFYFSGRNLLGLPRIPGIFMQPNTSGFFACVTIFLSYFYIEKSLLRTFTLFLIPLSILLSGSATAILIYVIVGAGLLMRKRISKLSISLSVAVIIITVLALPFLTGRITSHRNVFKSVTERVKIFSGSFKDSELISRQFGKGTNTMLLISEKLGVKDTDPPIDSTATAILVNTGLIGFLAFIFAYLFWIARLLRSNRPDAIMFTVIYTLFSFTLSITEAFPMNLIFAASIAYFLPGLTCQTEN